MSDTSIPEEKPVKQHFWSHVIGSNREFDSTLTIFFVFTCFFVSLGAVVVSFFLDKVVPKEFYDLLNVFENFILMILSYFFTRATTTGNGTGPMHRDRGGQR